MILVMHKNIWVLYFLIESICSFYNNVLTKIGISKMIIVMPGYFLVKVLVIFTLSINIFYNLVRNIRCLTSCNTVIFGFGRKAIPTISKNTNEDIHWTILRLWGNTNKCWLQRYVNSITNINLFQFQHIRRMKHNSWTR